MDRSEGACGEAGRTATGADPSIGTSRRPRQGALFNPAGDSVAVERRAGAAEATCGPSSSPTRRAITRRARPAPTAVVVSFDEPDEIVTG